MRSKVSISLGKEPNGNCMGAHKIFFQGRRDSSAHNGRSHHIQLCHERPDMYQFPLRYPGTLEYQSAKGSTAGRREMARKEHADKG